MPTHFLRGKQVGITLQYPVLTSLFLLSPIFSLPRMPKFEGVLEVNSNLTKTKRLFEGQLIGPESIAVDSTGNRLDEFLECTYLHTW